LNVCISLQFIVNGQCSGTAQDLTAEFNAYKTLKSTNYPASYDK